MQLFIMEVGSPTLVIRIDGDRTIRELKEKIYIRNGILPNFQRLTYGGHDLDNDRKIISYNFPEDPNLTLLLSHHSNGKILDNIGDIFVHDCNKENCGHCDYQAFCREGLNLSFLCSDKNCSSNNDNGWRELIWINFGLVELDIIKLIDNLQCSYCSKKINRYNIIFNGCYFACKGMNIKMKGYTAGNTYKKFYKKPQKIKHEYLKIKISEYEIKDDWFE